MATAAMYSGRKEFYHEIEIKKYYQFLSWTIQNSYELEHIKKLILMWNKNGNVPITPVYMRSIYLFL